MQIAQKTRTTDAETTHSKFTQKVLEIQKNDTWTTHKTHTSNTKYTHEPYTKYTNMTHSKFKKFL